ncbi:hypothetical protein [Massilia niastensis]|uniref:hypothetical protein n=1 Tax=Massilia niastensis TaxID=544911 RepID=UPI0003816468|nr:hypothetical protein [Massilia niastensis]
MRPILLFLSFLAALPASAHPGHGPDGHAWFAHAAEPGLVLLALAAIGGLAWWAVRKRRFGVLPLALAMAVALGAGTAGVTLPL